MFKNKKNVVGIVVSFLTLFVVLQFGFGSDRFVKAEADIRNPEFKSIEVTLQEAAVGDTVKISVDAEDNESGIDYVYVYYQMPITERVKGYGLNYNEETNRYEGTIDITNEMENGVWKVKWLHIKDNAGNE